MLSAVQQTTLFQDFQDYAKNMMLHVLNKQVVCGAEKNSYKTSCYTRRNGTTGIKNYNVETALDYPFLYYSTTFARNNVDRSEIIKTLIIDVDYRPVESTNQMHKLISDKILTPTFTTKTNKGYQFMFALKTPFILTEKGTKYITALNDALINKFEKLGIEVDKAASRRLTGTFRNPLVHEHKFSNLTYSADDLKKVLNLNNQTPTKHYNSISATLTNQNSSSEKYETQKKILDTGYTKGNRNKYFYLLANKECYDQNIITYEDALMMCNIIADDLYHKNPNEDKIPDFEIKGTANQLFKYKSNNTLFKPTIFCSETKNINNGKYRNELNATVGYTDVTIRRSAAMKMVQRDRKAKTLNLIKEAISSLSVEDYEIKEGEGFKTIYKKIALVAGISDSTVRRYILEDNSLLSNRLSNSYAIKKINVLDFMNPPKNGVLNKQNYKPANTKNYKKQIEYKELCISDASEEEIEFYERMGWEMIPF